MHIVDKFELDTIYNIVCKAVCTVCTVCTKYVRSVSTRIVYPIEHLMIGVRRTVHHLLELDYCFGGGFNVVRFD